MNAASVARASGHRPPLQAPLWQLLHATAALVGPTVGLAWPQANATKNAASNAQNTATTGAKGVKNTLEKPPIAAAAQALSFQVWRNWGRAQALSRLLVSKAPAPAVRLLLGCTLALLWQEADCPYDAHTLVSQAVEAAKRERATLGAAAFINACLRRFLRERHTLVAATDADPVALHNHPAWWLTRLQADHPAHWQAVAAANNRAAPLVIRAAAGFDAQALAQRSGVGLQPVGAGAFAVIPPKPVSHLAGFAQGQFTVQDAAAQLAAPLLLKDLATPLRILDACAAPGGKTAQLLALAPAAEVWALDVSAKRLELVRNTCERLLTDAAQRLKLHAADAADVPAWWDGQPFDAVLLDAPCSASGIVRRQPDVRWQRRESDIAQLAATQTRLLDALWPVLRPGGRMVFCTCSVFQAEGEAQAQAFQSRHTNVLRLPAPGQLLPKHGAAGDSFAENQPSDHDGFFFAKFAKTPQALA